MLVLESLKTDAYLNWAYSSLIKELTSEMYQRKKKFPKICHELQMSMFNLKKSYKILIIYDFAWCFIGLEILFGCYNHFFHAFFSYIDNSMKLRNQIIISMILTPLLLITVLFILIIFEKKNTTPLLKCLIKTSRP